MRISCAVSTILITSLALSGATLLAQTRQPPPPESAPTFSKDVAPIFYKHCVSCHRQGEIGPMPLVTYNDTRPWAKAIRERVTAGTMPPWFADRKYGTFHNDPRLTAQEIDLIVNWVNAGARQGDTANLPPLPHFVEGWQIGTPDLVVEMPLDYQIPPEGTIDYQTFEVPTNFTEDRWVQAVEARAGDRQHVHHIVVTVIEPEKIDRPKVMEVRNPPPETRPAGAPPQRQSEGSPTSTPGTRVELVTWASGEEPYVFPKGLAKRIPAGSTISFQLHYTTDGAPGRDRSRIGLIFAKEPPRQEVRHSAVTNNQFVIPPRDAAHPVEAEGVFTEDITLWTLKPHMHLRGKDIIATLTYPDGRSEILLNVPKYDFGWQFEYKLTDPLRVPKGSKLHVTAHFDNSTGNRNNPNPEDTVYYGDQTWDEMMNLNFHYTVDRERIGSTASGQP